MKRRDLVKKLSVSLLAVGLVFAAGCSKKEGISTDKKAAIKTIHWKW